MSKLPLASALCALSLLAGCYAEPSEEAAALLDAVSTTASESQENDEESGASSQAVATPTPVSYTHLDVYKRQGQSSTGPGLTRP